MKIKDLFWLLSFMCCAFSCSENAGMPGPENSVDGASEQETHINSNSLSDTIVIWDSIAGRPFVFRDWQIPLDSLLLFLPADIQLKKSTTPSLYYESLSDSITEISDGPSRIRHVKNPGVSYIEGAIIYDPRIRFQRGIRIGDNYETVCKKLHTINLQEKVYTKIYINDGELVSTLLFEFKDEKLYKASFWPNIE